MMGGSRIPPEELERIRAAAREAATRSRAEQGLPDRIGDPGVIAQMAALMRPAPEGRQAA
jgi:hypothetical protein